jgi:hypothetical protein
VVAGSQQHGELRQEFDGQGRGGVPDQPLRPALALLARAGRESASHPESGLSWPCPALRTRPLAEPAPPAG